MKFPRNARILRSQLDAAPLASVFFILVIFTMLASLVYTPGVHVELPEVASPGGLNDVPGTDRPTITIAMDAHNRLFQANRLITETELKLNLTAAASNSPALMLIVQADKAVTLENYVRIAMLAREVGVRDSLLQTLPRMGAGSPP